MGDPREPVTIKGRTVYFDPERELWYCPNWIEWLQTEMKHWGATPEEAYDEAMTPDG